MLIYYIMNQKFGEKFDCTLSYEFIFVIYIVYYVSIWNKQKRKNLKWNLEILIKSCFIYYVIAYFVEIYEISWSVNEIFLKTGNMILLWFTDDINLNCFTKNLCKVKKSINHFSIEITTMNLKYFIIPLFIISFVAKLSLWQK